MRFSVRRSLGGMAAAAIAALVAAGPAWAATTLTAPANGARTNGLPTFSGTASPDGTVTVKVWPGTATTPPLDARSFTTTSSGGNFSAPLPSPALAEGTYTARAELSASDVSPTTTFTVDRTGPSLGITNPPLGSRLATHTPTFTGAAGNAAGDSSTVAVKVLSEDGATTLQSFNAARPGATTWSATPSTSLPDGTYTLQVTQSDSVGNTTTAGRSFVIDTAPPALTLTSPAAGSTTTDATPGFGGAAGNSEGDGGSVVARVYAGATATGTPLQTITVTRSGATWSGAAGELAPGDYTVQATQTDNAGNSTVVASAFTVAAPVSGAGPVTPTPTTTTTTTPDPPPTTSPTPSTSPILLSPFPIVRIVGALTKKGAKLSLFTVRAPAGSTVRVSCQGKTCPFKSKSSKTGTKARTVRIKQFVGRSLRAGVVIEVRVSQAGRWGKFTRFRIRKGKAPLRADSCLRPGKTTSVRCPA